jgi:predicted DsbA family dithiol-disulfide isomerase
MDDQLFSDQINEDAALAREIGVSATPTFFINGIALSGAQPYSVFAEIIDYELQNQTN